MNEPSVQPPQWGATPAQQPTTRRKPRVLMWIILAVNALFAWWLISSVAGVDTNDEGAGIAVGVILIFILFLWALVDVILGVIYMVTRRR